MADTEAQPKKHEFWLKMYPDSPDNYRPESTGRFRIALGELIEARDRKTFPPMPDGPSNPDLWNKSGQIGFLGLTIANKSVPKADALPVANPSGTPILQYLYTDHEKRRVVEVLDVGIEPEYRRKGYGTLLMQRVEEIALEHGIDTIVTSEIQSGPMRDLNIKLGYTLFDGGRFAVKRLNVEVLPSWDQLSDQSRTDQLGEDI